MQIAKPIEPVLTASNFDFESQFIEINGHQIHYIESGTGDPIHSRSHHMPDPGSGRFPIQAGD